MTTRNQRSVGNDDGLSGKNEGGTERLDNRTRCDTDEPRSCDRTVDCDGVDGLYQFQHLQESKTRHRTRGMMILSFTQAPKPKQ